MHYAFHLIVRSHTRVLWFTLSWAYPDSGTKSFINEVSLNAISICSQCEFRSAYERNWQSRVQM